MNARLLAVPALLALALSASAQETAPAVTVLKAARLFDGTSRPTVAERRSSSSRAARSRRPARGLAVPAGATVIDLGDATLLPGFIDAHVAPDRRVAATTGTRTRSTACAAACPSRPSAPPSSRGGR